MPTAPNPKTVFNLLAFVTRLARGRPVGPARGLDLSGFSGTINFDLSGPGGGKWHCIIAPDLLRFFREPHPQPRATVSLAADEFRKFAMGHTSCFTARLTGRIRVVGDGHAWMILEAIVLQLEAIQKRNDSRGRIGRWLISRRLP